MIKTLVKTAAVILGVLAVLVGALFFNLEEVFVLLCGWLLFLARNLPKVTVNPAAVATGIVVIALLVCVTHYVGRRWSGSGLGDAAAPRRKWRFRWTLSLLIAVFVMFAAGFSAVGLARHIGWLLSSQESSYMEQVKYKLDG
jgi:hypothetical protein